MTAELSSGSGKSMARTIRPFLVTVEYKGGLDPRLDKEIRQAARPGRDEGSGFMFDEDLRGLGFGYKTRSEAVRHAKKIKKLFGRKVKAYAEGRIWP